jgi:soluble lytic murein transglycosylase
MKHQNASPAKTAVGLLIVALAISLAACGGGDAKPTTLTATPQDTVVTAQATGDLADAQELQRDGRYEEAIAAYQALAQKEDSPDQQQARFGLAQSYFALERNSDAVDQLEAYLDAKPPEEAALRARFLLGRTYAALGDAKKAQENLRSYAEEGGALAAYARVDLAELLTGEGKADKAIDELEEALASDNVPSTLAPSLLLRLGDAYANAGEDAKALQTYDRLFQEAPSDHYQPLALWGIATVSRRLGDAARWEQSLFDLVRQYPASPQALNALETLTAAGITVDLLSQGIVQYQRGAYDQALAALDGFLAADPTAADAARAHAYRGFVRQDQGAPDEALIEYEASLELDAAGSLAGEAAWSRAGLLEELGRVADAASAYGELWRAHPTSEHAAEAAFRSGFLPFRDGDVASAQAAWNETLAAPLGADGLARIHLWLGKAALALGDGQAATTQFQQTLQAAPDSFSALRAEAWAAEQGTTPLPVQGPATTSTTAPDWAAVESWLTASFGAEAPAPASPTPTQPAWLRGHELQLLGFRQEAENEFLAALSESATDPWGLYRLARSYHDSDLTHLAARAAGRALARSDSPLGEAPRALLELAFPLAYASLIDAAGRENEVSPLLLLALIRQESFYDPEATSVAGALGLTQVIPATAMEIADKLGRPNFDPRDLLEPSLNVEFGAFYLGDQLRLFDGSLYLALAAYNGGPGNALRWRDDPTAVDPDFLVETIDLEETRSYLQLVLTNYAVYRFLYGGASHPTLLPP